VARTKSTARPITVEELAAANLPPTSEKIPPSAEISNIETIQEFGSHEDGEIKSGNNSGDGEDISNVEVNLNELIGSKSLEGC
jgi:hypothetical protein